MNNVLHFRIFDGGGKVVVDTDEKSLTGQARQIEDLREQLESLWPPHELTRSENGRVITAVTSIAGQTRDLGPIDEPRKTRRELGRIDEPRKTGREPYCWAAFVLSTDRL